MNGSSIGVVGIAAAVMLAPLSSHAARIASPTVHVRPSDESGFVSCQVVNVGSAAVTVTLRVGNSNGVGDPVLCLFDGCEVERTLEPGDTFSVGAFGPDGSAAWPYCTARFDGSRRALRGTISATSSTRPDIVLPMD